MPMEPITRLFIISAGDLTNCGTEQRLPWRAASLLGVVRVVRVVRVGVCALL